MTATLAELVAKWRADADACENGNANDYYAGQAWAFDAAANELEAALSAGGLGEWVSVKDRLPENIGIAVPVLAFNASRPGKLPWIETMHPSWWGQFLEHYDEWGPDITHWQPLPPAPAAKGGERE